MALERNKVRPEGGWIEVDGDINLSATQPTQRKTLRSLISIHFLLSLYYQQFKPTAGFSLLRSRDVAPLILVLMPCASIGSWNIDNWHIPIYNIPSYPAPNSRYGNYSNLGTSSAIFLLTSCSVTPKLSRSITPYCIRKSDGIMIRFNYDRSWMCYVFRRNMARIACLRWQVIITGDLHPNSW